MPAPAPAELLKTLISIPSVNPMGRPLSGEQFLETRLSGWLQEFLTAHNLPCEAVEVAPGRTNLLSRIDGDSNCGTVLFDVHQDTVPVDGMTIPPFDPCHENGRISGRGACDVKGGMASMLTAFIRLHEERPAGMPTVVLSLSVDEEATSIGINHLANAWASGSGQYSLCPQAPDAAIIAEPTELDLVVAHRGAVRWTIGTSGRACHSSSPSLGINAIYEMGHVLQLLQEYATELPTSRPAHQLCGPATLSVGLINGGSSVNVVPDFCEIHVDRRVLPGEEPMLARQELIDWLAARCRNPLLHGDAYCRSPALGDELNGSLSAKLLTSVGRIDGQHRILGVPFGTHASRLAAIGIPSVVFGPGSIDQAHTKDEWIEERQLQLAADILFDFCSTPVTS